MGAGGGEGEREEAFAHDFLKLLCTCPGKGYAVRALLRYRFTRSAHGNKEMRGGSISTLGDVLCDSPRRLTPSQCAPFRPTVETQGISFLISEYLGHRFLSPSLHPSLSASSRLPSRPSAAGRSRDSIRLRNMRSEKVQSIGIPFPVPNDG